MTFSADNYLALEKLTKEMAKAAELQNFEQLTALSAEYGPMVELLSTTGASTPKEVASVEGIIRNILSYQRRISENTAPWLTQVQALLRQDRQEKALIDTYRSST